MLNDFCRKARGSFRAQFADRRRVFDDLRPEGLEFRLEAASIVFARQ
jgi:hypothetical protein